MDRLQRVREDIMGLEQALEESGSESEENELGVKRGFYRNTDVVFESRILITFRKAYQWGSCRYNNEEKLVEYY